MSDVTREPITREEMEAWIERARKAKVMLIEEYNDEIAEAIRSVLTSTPERPEPFSDEIQDPCPTCGQDLSNVDFRKYKKGRQDARGEGVESRQVGIVFKCKGCGREVEAFLKPEPEVDTEWLLREVETAFFSMWSANYGVDKKKEKKALELIKERLQRVKDAAKK